MTVQNIPVETLPFLYISGMNVSVASNTVIAIAPGQCRDSTDSIDMSYYLPIGGNAIFAEQHNNGLIPAPISFSNASAYLLPLFLNSAVVGLNGLDQGVLALSTNYNIWAIADSSGKLLNGGLISLQSNAAPLLPFGYDSKRLIGMVTTDSSTHFLAASVLNAVNYKGYYLSPAVSVLAGGNATSFTAIDMSGAIPTAGDPFVIALLTVTFTPLAAGDTVQFRPTGSSATANLVTLTGAAAGVAQTFMIAVNVGVGSTKPEIDYKVTVSGDAVSVSVNGYYVSLS
jgi:hypothetical protein